MGPRLWKRKEREREIIVEKSERGGLGTLCGAKTSSRRETLWPGRHDQGGWSNFFQERHGDSHLHELMDGEKFARKGGNVRDSSEFDDADGRPDHHANSI